MNPTVLFFFHVFCAMGLMVLVLRWYLMPRLRALPTHQALTIVLFSGAIRYVGTLLLVPAILSPGAPLSVEGAVGDVLCSAIAVVAILVNHGGAPIGRAFAWIYVVVGGLDMLWTAVRGFQTDLWSHLGGVWTLGMLVFPTVGVGLVLTIIFLVSPNEAVARQR